MRRVEPPDLASLSADQVQWVSGVCSKFEDQWIRGNRPAVQDFLHEAADDVDPVVRLVLLRELLTSERELRERDARAHDIDAYLRVFEGPGEHDVVDVVLSQETKGDGSRRFQIIGPHAAGGLGEVFIAHDRHLDRKVALKRIKQDFADDKSSKNRFVREAEITGQLEHPNIAPVYSLGQDRDQLPFYAMRFIEGQSLRDALSDFHKTRARKDQPGERLVTLRKLLGRVNAVCDAVAFAHSRGVLHRDIKPANVILGRFGETILADWGLAKRIGAVEGDSAVVPVERRQPDGAGMTEHGSVLGTLPYMSPEQARSATGPLGPASDIYSLGATLYHVLTGRPPFAGNDPEKLRAEVIEGRFAPPRVVEPGLPAALEAIVIKAMAHEPGDRYATATALAEDIEHWLADEPVEAWREPLSIQIGRTARRHRTLVLSAAAALLVGAIGLAGFSVTLASKNRELDGQRREAVDERNSAERARDLAFNAMQAIIATDKDQMVTEEARPYRAMLLDEGLRLSRQMIDETHGAARAERLRAQALMMEARIRAEKGERARADEVGKRAVDLLEHLVAHDPDDPENRDTLALLLHYYGTIATNSETVRSSDDRSTGIFKALLAENPQSQDAARWIAYIATNLHNVGDSYFLESEATHDEKRPDLLRRAIEAFTEGRTFCEERATEKSRTPDTRFSFALNARYLCRAYRTLASLLGDPRLISDAMSESIQWGKRSIDDFKVLADQDPSSYRNSSFLHSAQRELGIVLKELNRWDEAILAYGDARETLKMMSQRHGSFVSRKVQIQESIAMEDYNLINVLTPNTAANKQFIHELVEEAFAICEKLDVIGPLSLELRQVYAYVSFIKADEIGTTAGIPDVDLNRKAARLYQEIFAQDPANFGAQCFLLLARLELADALAARGRTDESTVIENDALATARGHPDVLLQTSYSYAISGQATDTDLNELDLATREKLRRRYSRRVIPLLRAAVAAGFKDVTRLLTDQAFAAFRSDPHFRSLVFDLQFPANPFARTP